MATLDTVEKVLAHFEARTASNPILRGEVPERPRTGWKQEVAEAASRIPRMPESWLQLVEQVMIMGRGTREAQLSPFPVQVDIATTTEMACLPGVAPYWREDARDRVLWVASYDCSFVYVAANDCRRFKSGEILLRFIGMPDPPLERLNSSMTQFFLLTANIDSHVDDIIAAGRVDVDADVVCGLIDDFTDDDEQRANWRLNFGIGSRFPPVGPGT